MAAIPSSADASSPADAEGKDPIIGLRLGDYEVLEHIGSGGMGHVYRGIQPVIKKRVAVKVLKPEYASDTALVARLIQEAEAVNSISHRNIIDIFGLGTLPDGRTYIIMEFLDGEPLDAYMRAHRPLPPLEAIELIADICIPLSAAHRANVIHRDLKPSNIFLVKQIDGSRYLKLLDFGLAKKSFGVDGKTAQTSATTVTGTPDYMAPEQCRGLDISPRTDLYALGILAYEMLTGALPFTGDTSMDVMMQHVLKVAPAPSEVRPNIPHELSAVVVKLMAKAPEERFESAQDVRNVLKAVAARLGSPIITPPPMSTLRMARFPEGTELPAPKPVNPSVWDDSAPNNKTDIVFAKAPKNRRVQVAVALGVTALMVGVGAVVALRKPVRPEPAAAPVVVAAPEPVVEVPEAVAVEPAPVEKAPEVEPPAPVAAVQVKKATARTPVRAVSKADLAARLAKLEPALAQVPTNKPFLKKAHEKLDAAESQSELREVEAIIENLRRRIVQ